VLVAHDLEPEERRQRVAVASLVLLVMAIRAALVVF